jgi:hypothetical protein
MSNFFKAKTWLITASMFIIAIAMSSAIVFYEFSYKQNIKTTSASSDDNIGGWAWNSNIGWISFNCLNEDCNNTNYGVNVDVDTGIFSGHAWSSSVGWISFDRSETGAPPGQPYLSGTYLADVNGAGLVNGWAKILSMGADGWIKLRKFSSDSGSSYGVSINPATGDFSGWAWNANNNGSGIGLISFNCTNESPACSGTNYKVIIINNPPAVTGLTAPNWSFAQASQSGALNAYLDWTFSDPDAGSRESAYQIIVNTQNNTNNPFFDSGKCVDYDNPSGKCKLAPGGSDHFPLQSALSAISSSLSYNTSYYWWIYVWDQYDVVSELTQYDSTEDTPLEADDHVNKTFTTFKHQFPLVNATWFPLNPSQGEKVKFTDQSQRYFSAAPQTAVACNPSICQWNWTVPGDASVENPTASSTNIIFNGAGAKTVTLRVTDLTDTGSTPYYSERTFNIDVNTKLPKWKEVKPE